jgi:hypothetical protein
MNFRSSARKKFLAYVDISCSERRQRWKKRKKKKSLELYFSIMAKEPKLLTRAHATSLKKSFMKKTMKFLAKSSRGASGVITFT